MSKPENSVGLAEKIKTFLSISKAVGALANKKKDDFSPDGWKVIRSWFTDVADVVKHNIDNHIDNSKEVISHICKRYNKFSAWKEDWIVSNGQIIPLEEKDFFSDYAEYVLDYVVRTYPAVVESVASVEEMDLFDNVGSERKEEDNFMSKFLGKISIADKIARIEALDLEHPSSIDWDTLFKENVLFLNSDSLPVLVTDILFEGDDCVLSYEEWKHCFDLEKKLVVAWTEYVLINNVFIPLQKLRTKRAQLFDKFSSSLDEQVRTNLRFEIQELDKEISSYIKVA